MMQQTKATFIIKKYRSILFASIIIEAAAHAAKNSLEKPDNHKESAC